MTRREEENNMTAKKRQTVKKSPARVAADKALQLTWVLKGRLKNVQLEFLRIGAMLAQVRDEKMFDVLHHPNLEDYAEKRLQLGESSLYRYLRVYDWTKASHPEWLGPKPKGFVPELDDVAGLMWIENELKRKDLTAADRQELEALQTKGLSGELRQRDLTEWRKKDRKTDTLQTYYNKFRSLRTRSARIAGMPPEALKCLDDAIAILKNHQQAAKLPPLV